MPQDPKNFKGAEKMKKLMYATDKDGNYTGIPSSGWEAENEATKQAWDAIEEELAETMKGVQAGTVSPIAWYMQKKLMDLPLLAQYVGKWQWQVKRHMKPQVFNELSDKMLEKYASVFEITVDELKSLGKNENQ